MTNYVDSDLRFSIVPEWILDADITHSALRVYAILARYADNETLEAFPSRETLAQRARCNVKTIDRAVQELQEIGALFKSHRKANNGFQSNVYTLRRIPAKMGSDTNVARVATPMSPPRDTNVALTITTELEPKNERAKFKNGRYVAHSALLQELHTKHPQLDILKELEAFGDFYAARGQAFKDWDAAFRTWVRRSADGFKEAKPAVKPAAKVPGARDWVEAEHDRGDHYACKGGEFGHPADWQYVPE